MTRYSPSQMKTYLECPRKWKLSREWEYGGPPRPGPMELGSLTHSLLDHAMNTSLSSSSTTNFILTQPDGVEMHELGRKWIEEKYPGDGHNQGVALKQHLPYAISMVRNVVAYFTHSGFFDTYEVIGIEQPFEMNVGDNELYGIIDLLLRHKITGHYAVLDYKTSASLARGLHAADWQLLVYALLLEAAGLTPYYGFHLKIKKIKFEKKAKAPFTNLEEIRFNEVKLAEGKVKVEGLLDRMQHDRLLLPIPTATCMSRPCQFLDPCESMDSNQDHEYVLSQTHVRITNASSEVETSTAPHPAPAA